MSNPEREVESVSPEFQLSNIKWVWFDMDGTLYERNSEIDKMIFDQAVRLVADHKGIGNDNSRLLVESRYSELKSMSKTLAEFGLVGRDFMASVWSDLPLEDYIGSNDRLVRFVEDLRGQGKKVGIISNANRGVDLKRKLELLGFGDDSLDCVIGTADLPEDKPSPHVFMYAMMQVGCMPDECVYVGDSGRSDILGASGVGMKTIKIGKVHEKADLVVGNVLDLEDVFGV